MFQRCPRCGGPTEESTCPRCRPKESPLLPVRPGQIFHGLEILRILGRGAMGVVYQARDPQRDRIVAVKVLTASSAEIAARFVREAKTLARLNHPNIVAMYEFGDEAGLPFFTMEFVDGPSLEARRSDPEETLRIIFQVCDALDYAHAEGIVHRDLKPENILVDGTGRAKVADFGVAKWLGPGTAMMTFSGAHLGTAAYAAPEQTEDPRRVDARADLYSLGVVLYEALTGRLPLAPCSLPSDLLRRHPGLDAVVFKAFERDAASRHATAREFRAALERCGILPRDSGETTTAGW